MLNILSLEIFEFKVCRLSGTEAAYVCRESTIFLFDFCEQLS